jgi:hypothetical protein
LAKGKKKLGLSSLKHTNILNIRVSKKIIEKVDPYFYHAYLNSKYVTNDIYMQIFNPDINPYERGLSLRKDGYSFKLDPF